jgi:hypothetical protein
MALMVQCLQVRCGACIALLSLVSHTGGHPALRPRLPDIQVNPFCGQSPSSGLVSSVVSSCDVGRLLSKCIRWSSLTPFPVFLAAPGVGDHVWPCMPGSAEP